MHQSLTWFVLSSYTAYVTQMHLLINRGVVQPFVSLGAMLRGSARLTSSSSSISAAQLTSCGVSGSLLTPRGATLNICTGRSFRVSALHYETRPGPARSGFRQPQSSVSQAKATAGYTKEEAAEKDAAFAATEAALKKEVEQELAKVEGEIKELSRASDGDLPDMEDEAKALYIRLNEAISVCQEGLIERDVEVRLMLLAALSGEHVLFIGPPGTAKSELGRRLSRLYNGAFFERLLTRFSVPEELFGPLSMAALEDDKYMRQTAGYLPTASVAFIDEIFKANSAILNTLLTILNERLFDNGTTRSKVPLICLVGASNELPESEELDALYDRFLVRKEVKQVSPAGLYDLLRMPDTSPTASSTTSDGGDPGAAQPAALPPGADSQPKATQLVTSDDFDLIRVRAAREVTVPEEVQDLLVDLRTMLQTQMEPAVYVSDRRLLKAISIMKVSAFTNGRSQVSLEDCMLLQHLMWQRPAESGRIGDWLVQQLAVGSTSKQCKSLFNSLFTRTMKAFQDETVMKELLQEVTALKQVLVSQLVESRQTSGGNVPRLTQHLWLGQEDAKAAATSLAPKLRAGRKDLTALLSDTVSLEVCLTRNETVVATATLLPEMWAEFISGTT